MSCVIPVSVVQNGVSTGCETGRTYLWNWPTDSSVVVSMTIVGNSMISCRAIEEFITPPTYPHKWKSARSLKIRVNVTKCLRNLKVTCFTILHTHLRPELDVVVAHCFKIKNEQVLEQLLLCHGCTVDDMSQEYEPQKKRKEKESEFQNCKIIR